VSNVNLEQNHDKKKYDVHELSEKELDDLPIDEKHKLVAIPGEEGAAWENVITREGDTIGSSLSMPVLKMIAPNFYDMLEAIKPTTKSHLAFGGFKFSYNPKHNKCFRNTYNKNATPWAKKTYSAPPPEDFIGGVFFGNPGETNDFLLKDENKGKWKRFGDWKSTGSEIIVGLYKSN
jgi:hypothetical protein